MNENHWKKIKPEDNRNSLQLFRDQFSVALSSSSSASDKALAFSEVLLSCLEKRPIRLSVGFVAVFLVWLLINSLS